MKITSKKFKFKSSGNPKTIGFIFTLLGFIFIPIGIFTGISSKKTLDTSIRLPGSVIDLIAISDDDGTTYKPKISFQSPDNQTTTFISTISSSPPRYSIGEPVEVLYSPENPNKTRINSSMELWLLPIIFVGMGGLFTCVGIALLTELIKPTNT